MSIVEKDVTLRQQDDAGEYDKLYVATTATQTKLTASTAALFDGDVKNADDAMAAIVGEINNIGYIKVKILDPNGNPVPGAIIGGMTGSPVTLADGTAHGIVESNLIRVVSPYIDLANKTVDVTGIGSFAPYVITLSVVENKTITFSTSKTIKFSTATSTADICLVGGGGGGAPAARYSGAGGGGGGETKNVYNVPITANQDYQVIVGSGGAVPGNAGGNSKFENYIATGGQGASGQRGGNGTGGNGGDTDRPGSDNATVSMFDDGKTFYGGGGGGGTNGLDSAPKGGSPNGASGASAYIGTNAGVAGIGGGGGGGSFWSASPSGAGTVESPSQGGDGLVVIRLK